MLKKILVLLIITITLVLVVKNNNESGRQEILSGSRAIIGDEIFYIETADTQEKYLDGLSGRPSLNSDAGLLFIFDKPDFYPFWMKDMLFPIDIIWVSNNRVIGFDENLQPDNNPDRKLYRPPAKVDKVLEINAGEIARRQIKTGDQVVIE